MPTFKITVAYDGTEFVGWQRQATGVSIQGLLEDAARELAERDVTVVGAGRTDAGVHALAQIAAFTLAREIHADTVLRALNARLPDAVRVVAADEVPSTFHPQFDARAKRYRYRIWNGDVLPPFERRYAWHVPGALDVGAMQLAARLLEGEHDFAAFQSSGSDVETTVRRILKSAIADRTIADLIEYDITGTGFLRHMVRTIVGSLVEVGRGRQRPEWMSAVVESRDRSRAGRAAPAAGLFLVGVDYDVHSGFTAKDQ